MSTDAATPSYILKPIKSLFGISLDILFILCILLTLHITLIHPESQQLHFDTFHNFFRFYWLASPILLIYLALRICKASSIFSNYITIGVTLLLSHINTEKTTLTGEPISFNDLTAGQNLSVASKYLTSTTITLFLFFLLTGVFCFFIGRKIKTRRMDYYLLVFAFIVTAPLALSPYVSTIFGDSNPITQKTNLLATKYDVTYRQWDWPGNVSAHGLPMHLVQTSVRKSIPSFSDSEQETYSTYKKNTALSFKRPKTIVYILCESCWFDNNNFKEDFQPLLDAGFKTIRAKSPVYGGGTANVEFEMLTGLSSNSGVLSGIIYQEYSSLIKSNADSLPGILHNQGYKSVAVHNFVPAFWHRDVIYNKFGFDKFIALPDMGELPPEYSVQRKPWQWQPDDFLLYRSVLNEISNNKDRPHFFNLITMSTHGPSDFDNDYGEHQYAFKVRESMSRMTAFTKKLLEIDPNAVIIVYGDHKPGMNRYFYEHRIFPDSFFIKKGAKDTDFQFSNKVTADEFGDVPVFIKSNNIPALNSMIKEANNKPYFCVSSAFDKYFIQSGLPAFQYNMEHGCQSLTTYNYKELTKITPPWMYSLALFQ